MIFPDGASVIRLVRAVLFEVHDDWHTAERRYLFEGSRSIINKRVTAGAGCH